MEEFLLKLSAVWARAFWKFASPVRDRIISKNIGFKGHEIIGQSGTPKCVGPALRQGLLPISYGPSQHSFG